MRITREMLQRAADKRLTAPCVICGGKLELKDWVTVGESDGKPIKALRHVPGHTPEESCGHTLEDTEAVHAQIAKLSDKQREEIVRG